MAWVTEEEYQAAKQVRAYEYLQTYQPGRLKKTRTRNEWQLQDHDSFKILPGYRGEWFPVPLKRASSAASFPLVKFQLEIGILSIVLQNHSGIVGLAGFLRI